MEQNISDLNSTAPIRWNGLHASTNSLEISSIKREAVDSEDYELPNAVKLEADQSDADLVSTDPEDGIEVFKFDRNSLKLRCEKISPKGFLKQNGTTGTSTTKEEVVVKTEKCSSSDSSSSSTGFSSSSSSSSGSSSGSSSSSDSDSDSSSSSSSFSSSSSVSSGSREQQRSDLSKSSKTKKSGSSSSSQSSSSSSSTSSSSSGTEASDVEDKLKRHKVRRPKKRKRDSKGRQIDGKTDLRNGKAEKPKSKITNNVKVETGAVNEILNAEPRFGEDDEDPDEDSEDKINIDDLIEGRNKQRKNSKWADYVGARKSSRLVPKASFCNKNYEAQIKKRLRTLLKKDPSEWTDDDRATVQSFPKLVSEVEKGLLSKEIASERLKEAEDPPEVLESKCTHLASVISRARYLIIYTGAGISTSAKIPDYRGPNGIWTLLQKGEEVAHSLTDISQTADPTLTHMAIKDLWDRGIAKHIVSQNVDGLHLRSGIPKTALSEVHGNMYVEVCVKCSREFVRLFDVTENTRRRHHKTGRFCYHCGFPLKDSVVLFGEKGSLKWPLNWAGAEYHADKADVILCLGSSLKVLRRYPWLWCMSKPAPKRPKLYIVNLQWTPKDQFARLKINGKCDEVMERVMAHLTIPIPAYSRQNDTIFTLATVLHPLERDTKSSTDLIYPSDLPSYPEKNKDLRNYIRFEPVFKVPVPYENREEPKDKSLDVGDEDEVSNVKAKKRVLKGNNSGWLGNAVNFKQQKKRKLK